MYMVLTNLSKAQYKRTMLGVKSAQKIYWIKRCEAFYEGVRLYEKHCADPLFVSGLMLYWAEGAKRSHTALSNSDPRLIRLFILWLSRYHRISKDAVVLQMHLHSNQNEKELRQYWSKLTSVPLKNFHKTFTKIALAGSTNKPMYNGTIRLRVRAQGSTYLLYRIRGSLAAFVGNAFKNKALPEEWIEKPKFA